MSTANFELSERAAGFISGEFCSKGGYKAMKPGTETRRPTVQDSGPGSPRMGL